MGRSFFGEARLVRSSERDVELALESVEWPGRGLELDGWKVGRDSAKRRIGMERRPWRRLAKARRRTGEVVIEERLLRFPSAPIHGVHRLTQDHLHMGPIESFHSCRVLSQPWRRGRVSRIFLMHNGLNEIQNMGLYYRLASYLIEQDAGTVCVLRPFPGHLSRCPYPGLSETPLDHYLWDGLHLFRQFLRFMIETRWLLSTICRYSSYHCISGGGLLGESSRRDQSRLSPEILTEEMSTEWRNLRDASAGAIGTRPDDSPTLPDFPGTAPFRQAIVSLRKALGVERYAEQDGSEFVEDGEPELHVIGYSLGGFTAQSVFMSWPFLVSSCSTLLSGGAMRELAPTAFADPEEWQTVLHSLRYELDDALMDERFRRSGSDRVAGLDASLFRYLKRTFYEVFEQEYRGSFQTRLAAFRQRMLFLVGGNDPIVRPQNVLDSGPPDGINLISVGGLGHFLEGVARGSVEEEQRAFWLPEIGRTIGRLSRDAAAKHRPDLKRTWLDEEDLVRDEPGDESGEEERPRDLDRLSVAERLQVERDGTLPSLLFQRSLDDLAARAISTPGRGGLLFVLKNEPPTFLLGKRALQQRALAMYHEETSIVDYVRSVQRRGEAIREKGRNRVCVILSSDLPTILRNIDSGSDHPSQSETSGEEAQNALNPTDVWHELATGCAEWIAGPHQDWIRIFDGRRTTSGRQVRDDGLASAAALSAVAREQLKIEDPQAPVIPALPDCWVWLSDEFFKDLDGGTLLIDGGIQHLATHVPSACLGKKNEPYVAELLRGDALRLVTISRARYNPRFRGRIIAEPRQAQELLLRVALCIVTSVRFQDFEFPSIQA